MTYRVTLTNATSGWVVDEKLVDTLHAAVQLQNRWFHEFHAPLIEDWVVRPGLINLPVTVTITSAEVDIV